MLDCLTNISHHPIKICSRSTKFISDIIRQANEIQTKKRYSFVLSQLERMLAFWLSWTISNELCFTQHSRSREVKCKYMQEPTDRGRSEDHNWIKEAWAGRCGAGERRERDWAEELDGEVSQPTLLVKWHLHAKMEMDTPGPAQPSWDLTPVS